MFVKCKQICVVRVGHGTTQSFGHTASTVSHIKPALLPWEHAGAKNHFLVDEVLHHHVLSFLASNPSRWSGSSLPQSHDLDGSQCRTTVLYINGHSRWAKQKPRPKLFACSRGESENRAQSWRRLRISVGGNIIDGRGTQSPKELDEMSCRTWRCKILVGGFVRVRRRTTLPVLYLPVVIPKFVQYMSRFRSVSISLFVPLSGKFSLSRPR